MAYASYAFVFFVLATLAFYYRVPQKLQWKVLLFANVIFYATYGPVYLLYLFFLSWMTWFGALKLGTARVPTARMPTAKVPTAGKPTAGTPERRTAGFPGFVLAMLILANLGFLFGLKWSGIELALLNRIFGAGLSWRIVLPLGISFFTFQNTAYLMDVYRGKYPAEKNFWHYFLYAGYFPYIVSGPINRYERMEGQFFCAHRFDGSSFYEGCLRILWGYLKKMVLADRAAIFVNLVFERYYMYRGIYILLAVLLFSLQLYMDFSGCMDIVLGVSKLFGIEMEENFRAPYRALTIAEFWRRWHISLTSWFRDYLYIPLGGNRKGKGKKYRNLMIVFLFCGAWHGAGLTYLVWGFLNGFYQIVGERTSRFRKKVNCILGLKEDSFGAVLRKRLTVLSLSLFAWLFFRAEGIREALIMVRRLFTGWNPWILTDGSLFTLGLDAWDFGILLAGTLCVGWVSGQREKRDLHGEFVRQSWLFQTLVILAAVVVWYLFGVYGPGLQPADFIYYNF